MGQILHGQAFQVFHGSQLLLHLPEISHRIAAVRASLYCVKKRHQMHIVHITRFQIIKLLFHAPDRAGKIVDIEHHAQHIVPFIPVRMLFPLFIRLLQRFAPLCVIPAHLIAQLSKHGAVVIKLRIKPFQLLKMT